MGKDYLAALQEWVKQKKGLNGNSANSARVVFLAIREDVEDAIDAGYSLKTIWEHMHETGRVSTTYETFRRHVRRYVHERRKSVVPVVESTPARSQDTETVIPEKQPVKREPSALPSFNFNPGKKKGIN